MIGLRQEKKALLTRSGGAREKFFQVLPLAVFASRRLFLLDAEHLGISTATTIGKGCQYGSLPNMLSICSFASRIEGMGGGVSSFHLMWVL